MLCLNYYTANTILVSLPLITTINTIQYNTSTTNNNNRCINVSQSKLLFASRHIVKQAITAACWYLQESYHPKRNRKPLYVSDVTDHE